MREIGLFVVLAAWELCLYLPRPDQRSSTNRTAESTTKLCAEFPLSVTAQLPSRKWFCLVYDKNWLSHWSKERQWMRRPNKSLANLVFSEAGLSHAFDGKPGQDSSRLFLLFMFVYRIDVCIFIQRCLQRFSFCGNCVKPSDKPGREAYEMRKRKVFSPPLYLELNSLSQFRFTVMLVHRAWNIEMSGPGSGPSVYQEWSSTC